MAYNLMDLRRRIIASQPHELKKSGSIVTFGTNLVRPMLVTASITPVQDLSGGEPSPSHICPITGWTGAEVTGAGVNMWDKTANDTDKGFVTGYYLFATGTLNQGADWRISEYFKVKPNTAYTLSGLMGNSPAVCFYDANKTFVSGTAYNGNASVTVTTGATVAYCRLSFKTDNINSVQIEEGSSASAYSAFDGTTLSVTFPNPPGTVYGGTLKINKDGSGVLTVDRVSKTLTGAASENWNFSTNRTKNRVYTTELESDIDKSKPIYTNYLKGEQNNSYPDEWYYFNSSLSVIIGIPTTISSASDWRTYLSSNNLQIVYYLATPVEYPLTSQQVGQLMSKLGVNHVWADSGNVEVEYLGY